MSPDPIPQERLAAIGDLDLDTLLPLARSWSAPTRAAARQWVRHLAPILHELLTEIAELDADLDDAEAEIERERARVKRLSAILPNLTSRVSRPTLAMTAGGRWQVRWSEDGRRRSATYPTKHEARQHMEYVLHAAYRER